MSDLQNEESKPPGPSEGDSERQAEVCQLCGGPSPRRWQTPQGPAVLCGPCAVMNDIGCP